MVQRYSVINRANNGTEDLKKFGVRIDVVADQHKINERKVLRMKSLYEVESMERIEAQQQITPDIIENIGIDL